MAAKQKFYVVWKGRKTGIFFTWEECKEQVREFEGALFRGYNTITLATEAFSKPFKPEAKKKAKQLDIFTEKPLTCSISVDAALSSSTLKMEYRGVETDTGKLLFYNGPFEDATNNIGEFLAIVHALALCKKKGISKPVYSDSVTAISWIKKKKAKTKLLPGEKNAVLFELIARAEKWLLENTWENKLLKWNTAQWGEIPADFGRK